MKKYYTYFIYYLIGFDKIINQLAFDASDNETVLL